MMENALKCKYNGGTLPIGYKVDKEQNYEIDEVTAPAVVLAFKSYAEGMTMQHIAICSIIKVFVHTEKQDWMLILLPVCCTIENISVNTSLKMLLHREEFPQ